MVHHLPGELKLSPYPLFCTSTIYFVQRTRPAFFIVFFPQKKRGKLGLDTTRYTECNTKTYILRSSINNSSQSELVLVRQAFHTYMHKISRKYMYKMCMRRCRFLKLLGTAQTTDVLTIVKLTY